MAKTTASAKYPSLTLHRREREAIEAVCPPLIHNRQCQRAYNALCTLPRLEDGIPISTTLMTRRYKNDPTLTYADRDHHMTIEDDFRSLEAYGFSFYISYHNYYRNRAASITYAGVPRPIAEATYCRNKEVCCSREELVDFTSGKRMKTSDLNDDHEQRHLRVTDLNKHANEDKRIWTEYMNNLPMKSLRPSESAIQRTDDYISVLEHDAARRAEILRCGIDADTPPELRHEVAQVEMSAQYARHAMRAVCLDPVALYKVTARSPRLYCDGVGWQTAPREVRRLLMPNVVEMDLQNCHTAIFSVVCECDALFERLRKGKLWPYLLGELGIIDTSPVYAQYKETIKPLVNAILYGTSENQWLNPMRDRSLDYWVVRQLDALGFAELPLISQMFASARAMLTRIMIDGGKRDIYGNWIGGNTPVSEQEARSILSQVIQSYEWELLEPVRHETLALKTGRALHGWDVTIWQHDGFSFRPRYWEDAERIAAYLIALTQAKIDTFGFPTRLEYSPFQGMAHPLDTEKVAKRLLISASSTSPEHILSTRRQWQ